MHGNWRPRCKAGGERTLLGSYERERKPIAQRNTIAARLLTQHVGNLDIPPDLERDYDERGVTARARFGGQLEVFRGQFASLGVQLAARYDGSEIICPDGAPPPDDPLEYRPSSVPGGRLPHLWIHLTKGKRRSVFDDLHAGFTLLRIGPVRRNVDAFRAAARERRIPLQVLDVGEDKAFDLYQCRLLLVRPDQHIAWRGDHAPQDAGAVLDEVVGISIRERSL
ncbi:hypothetical protein BPMI_01386 [Candidatus Burkholderia pumila]|uniref:FAD-binding domain-containing protein n=1 Tax=Candidatus Burkholderia pumila TaxID=1090375 RepID=A0ABR5HK66_9BURK|nr:hypothetical protein BPMI_01386 [Candidatus Burkholderia pumila]